MQPDAEWGQEDAPPEEKLTKAPKSRSGSEPLGLLPDQEFHGILGAGVFVRGMLSFAGRVRVEGTVHGDVEGGELLVIASRANIVGTVRAREVIVLGGTIEGDIFAEESIELRVPCSVRGNLTAPEVFLDRGVDFEGQCFMKRER